MTSGLVAGNTAETLAGTPVEEAAAQTAPQPTAQTSGLPSADDLDRIAEELHAAAATERQTTETTEVSGGVSSTDSVTREEFNALVARIDAFNKRSGQKI